MSSVTIAAVGYGFGYIFTVWPLIILSPLKWKKENVLAGMVVAWTLLLFGWLFAMTVSHRPLVVLIPEPLNTYLFFLTGLALLVWGLLRELRRQRFLQAIAVDDRSAVALLEMSTSKFEDLVIELYRSLGYKASRLRDRLHCGREILLQRGDGRAWLVQCRSWHGPVGDDVVQEFWERVRDHEVDGGILITTGTFSRGAREWANLRRISLLEGEEFLEAWRQRRAS